MSLCQCGSIPGPQHIDTASRAIDVFTATNVEPDRPSTMVMFLHADGSGGHLVSVTDTAEPDDVIGVVEALSQTRLEFADSMVVASVRPPGRDYDEPLLGDGPMLADDHRRWLEITDIAEHRGIELIDWFVFSRTVACPRAVMGEPSRW